MNCEEIVKVYLDSLREKFIVEPVDSGCIIYTPYLDPSNDPLSIFVEKIDDHYRISDMTQAFEYLFLHGIEIKPESNQQRYLNVTLNRLGISLVDNELYINVPKEGIPDGILHLTEALKTIEDFVVTAKPRKYSDFGAEVAGWLRDKNIIFERKKEYTGLSGAVINVDFVIPRRENPAFLYALHSESRGNAITQARRVFVNFIDLEKAGMDFYSICVLDDILGEDLWDASYRLLKTYTRKVVFWDDKEELMESFA